MTILVGTAASASLRYLLSVNLGPLVGLKNSQAVVFNALDMTISSFACFLLAKMGKDEIEQVIFGRGLGFTASLIITYLTFGPLNLGAALVISIVSQIVGMFVNIGTTEGDHLLGIT
jgi:kynureninase